MPTFEVDVQGRTYEVDAPDVNTAWEWATQAHLSRAEDQQMAVPVPTAPAEPQTTLEGLAGAATRGLALPAAGATAGAIGGAFFGGVGAGPGALAGGGAGVLAQTVGDPVVETINNLFGTKYTLPTDAMEDMLTRLGVAEARTEAEKVVKAAAAGAGGAGGAIGLGRTLASAAASPVTRGVGSTLAASPGAQVVGGATGGAAAEVARQQGAGTAGQLAAGLLGGVAGGAAAGSAAARMAGAKKPVAPTPKDIAAQQAVEAGEQAGVKVMTSDVLPPETFMGRQAQALGERIPIVGTGPVRAAQQTQRIEAVREVLKEYGADDAATSIDNVAADLLNKRAKELTKYTDLKRGVMSSLDEAGEVPVARAMQALDEQIAKQTAIGTNQSMKVVAVLNDFKNAAQGKSLSVLDRVRAQIGKAFDGESMADVKDDGVKALQAVYGPLRQDMDEFIKSVGARRDITKWRAANKRLSEMAGELENTALKSVLRSGSTTPENVTKLLMSKKPSDLRTLYAGLTEDGRANARAAILAKAAKDAQTEVGGMSFVSPDRFANNMKRLEDAANVFFKGDDKKRIDGLVRVLNVTKRAAEASASPSTGVQSVPYLAGGAVAQMTGTLAGAAATTVGIGGAARLYESPVVRDLLLKIARTAPKSKEESAIAKRIITTMQAQSAQSSEKEQKNEKLKSEFLSSF